MHVYRPIYLKK